MKTLTQIKEVIKPFQILHEASNYIQYVDHSGVFKQAQKCYQTKRWYNFTESGRSDSPIEKITNYID